MLDYKARFILNLKKKCLVHDVSVCERDKKNKKKRKDGECREAVCFFFVIQLAHYIKLMNVHKVGNICNLVKYNPYF